MKNLTIILLLLSGLNIYSQTNSTQKRHRHELGADITGLLSQFFNLNTSNFSQPMSPIYYMTYRYHLKKSNIRFGIGGLYSKTSLTGYKVEGEEKVFYRTYSNFSFRLGYEFVNELSKRWQAFYGFDFRPTIINTNDEARYSNGGYITGYKSKSTIYGFAPLLGFRFRINDRVSITTEASFSYNIAKNSTQNTYVSQDNSIYPYKPADTELKTTNIDASFSQPLFLTLTVKL